MSTFFYIVRNRCLIIENCAEVASATYSVANEIQLSCKNQITDS